MLKRFLASEAVPVAALVVDDEVEVGLVAVRAGVAEVEVREAVVEPVNFPTDRLAAVVVVGRAVADFLSASDPVTLALRSAVVEVAALAGALVAVLPATDIRLAALEMPLLSSPELATDFVFSSAELLMDARDRCEAVVEVPDRGFRAVDVVVGRVGGLFKVAPLVLLRNVDVVDLPALPEVAVPGRLDVVVPDLAAVPAVALFFAGDAT